MRFFIALLSLALLSGAGLAHATEAPSNLTQSYQTVGQGPFRWMGMKLYTAKLLTPSGQYAPNQPLALELTYARTLNGATVAKTTLTEMRRMGFTDATRKKAWQPKLTQWFSGIQMGTKLTAVRNANGSTTFIRNGTTVLGTIEDPAFAQYFFAIWLSEKTQGTALRRQLIGLK